MLVALLVDATIVRMLLVPGHDEAARSTGTGGRRRPMRRWWERYGLRETDALPAPTERVRTPVGMTPGAVGPLR